MSNVDRLTVRRPSIDLPPVISRGGALHTVVQERRRFLEDARGVGLIHFLFTLSDVDELVARVGAARDIAFLPYCIVTLALLKSQNVSYCRPHTGEGMAQERTIIEFVQLIKTFLSAA